jgi:hypothetical protein
MNDRMSTLEKPLYGMEKGIQSLHQVSGQTNPMLANHDKAIKNLEAKLDRVFTSSGGRTRGDLPSNTIPNLCLANVHAI